MNPLQGIRDAADGVGKENARSVAEGTKCKFCGANAVAYFGGNHRCRKCGRHHLVAHPTHGTFIGTKW